MTTQQERLTRLFEIVDDYKNNFTNQDYIIICGLFKECWTEPQQDNEDIELIKSILRAERSLRKKAQKEVYQLKNRA